MNIRAIIFDFGGVISVDDDLSHVGRRLAKKYGVDQTQLDATTLRTWMKALVNPKQDEAFWSEVANVVGISGAALMNEFLDFHQPSSDVVRLVRQLREHYVVAMLSNQISSLHHALMKRWELDHLFHPVVTSYDEGILKPNPEIYTRLVQKLSLLPTECLFIDDREENLVPANELGMQTILFQKPEQLFQELKKREVKF